MEQQRVSGRQSLAMLVPDIAETSTVKRAEGFLDNGFDVTVFGFLRRRYNRDFVPGWRHVILGRTADGHYAGRLLALLAALPILVRHRARLCHATVIYVRNIDQLLLALTFRTLTRCEAAIVYEVLDVNPAFTGNGVVARLLRKVERACLNRIRLLVLSSPGFLNGYFGPVHGYWGPWFLLENKLSPAILKTLSPALSRRSPSRRANNERRPWVVGYVGLIRGRPTLDLIARIAERLHGEVIFRFRGVLTTIDQEHFEAVLDRCANVVYDGDFVNPGDLQAVYHDLDFAWAVDLENATNNSRWLLPCRFYEAGLFGVPCLVARGFQVGNLVDSLRAGWSFDEPLDDSLVRFFQTLTVEIYEERRRHLLDLPRTKFVADNEMATLSNLLSKSPRRSKLRPSGALADVR